MTRASTRNVPSTPADAETGAGPGSPDWRVAVPGDDDTPEENAQDRVASMLRDMRESQLGQIKLYRLSSATKKLAWCADYTPAEFEESGGFAMIRQQWGPGSYELRLYGPKPETGVYGVLGRSQIEIVAPLISPTAAAAPSELATILQTMAANQAAMLEALTNRPAPLDPMSEMSRMLAMMGAMREAMGLPAPGTAASGGSIKEIVGAIRELRGAADEILPKEKTDADPSDPMTYLPGILELVKTAMQQNPQAMAQLIPGVRVPALGNAPLSPGVANSPMPETRAPAQPLRVVESPASTPTVAGEVVEVSETPLSLEQQETMLIEMREVFAQLLKMAGTDPVKAAEFVFSELPEAGVPLIADEKWFDMLAMIEPGAVPHRDWLTLVRDATVRILIEEGELPPAGDAPATLTTGEANGAKMPV